MEMNDLPWHLQMEIYKKLDLDTLRRLGVTPGRLCVPTSLQNALHKSFFYKKHNNSIIIPIKNTEKFYHLWRMNEDDDGQIECDVAVRNRDASMIEHFILYRANGHQLAYLVDILLRLDNSTLINLNML